MHAQAAIGVFDSGVGGLTVVRSLTERLPKEEIVYLGDSARVPYGSKSAETVVRYSRNAARFLVGEGVKMIVVACNTASAFALDALRAELPLPVLGAVEPGARAAVAATRTGRVGVIGTLGTVRSGSYVRAIAAVDAHVSRHGARLPAAGAARRGGLARRRRGRGGGAALPDGARRRGARPRRHRARLHALSAVAPAAHARGRRGVRARGDARRLGAGDGRGGPGRAAPARSLARQRRRRRRAPLLRHRRRAHRRGGPPIPRPPPRRDHPRRIFSYRRCRRRWDCRR